MLKTHRCALKEGCQKCILSVCFEGIIKGNFNFIFES